MSSFQNMATTTPPPKKRCWGKSNREKINIIENMELEILDEVDCSSTSDLSAQANHMTISDNNDANIDLQHPELLTNAQMVDLFTERRVPVPVYEDGSYSRERLLFLFRKHILPKPQRKKLRSRNQRYKDEIYHKKDGSETMEWTNTVQDIIREDVSRGLGDGENSDGILGKRKLTDSSVTDNGESLQKKPPTISTTHSKPNTTVRKIKRPINRHKAE